MANLGLPKIVYLMTEALAQIVMTQNLKVNTDDVPAIICAGDDVHYPFN